MKQSAWNIKTRTGRGELPPRGEPYWHWLGTGQAIGFRKTETGAGTWVARWTDSVNIYHRKGLGRADRLDFEEARKLAAEWFTQCDGGVLHSGSVEEACRQYVSNQRSEKGDRAATSSDRRFEQHVYGTAFGKIDLSKLTTREIERWRDGLVTESRQKNSVNRDLRSLKAALNFAFQHGMCPSDVAWRRVRSFKGAAASDRPRTVSLTAAQRQRLLAECDDDLANLLRGLLYTGGRPFTNGELPMAKVSDLDLQQKSLTLRSYKGDGSERKREVPLSDVAVTFFRELSRDKLPGAYLFTYLGHPWPRHVWSAGIKAAVVAANKKIDEPSERLPKDTCAYTMRHCAITDWLKAGINVSTAAKMAGTSVAMIERYYFKYIATDIRDKLALVTAF